MRSCPGFAWLMTSIAIVLGLPVQCVNAQNVDSELRTWTSKDGQFSVQAKFASFKNQTVNLTKENEEQLSVAIDRLSLDDQVYVATAINWGRIWKNRNGKTSHVAEFDSIVNDKKIRLTSITGNKTTILLSALGPEDRQHVGQLIAAKESARLDALAPGAPTTVQVPMDVESSEKAIRERIASCVKQSAKIRIDGNDDDWQQLPTFFSNANIPDGTRDIVRVGIAPREKDLVVLIQTRERPAQAAFSFFIRVDFFGRQNRSDFQIGLNPSADQKFKVYDEANRGTTVLDKTIKGVKVKIRNVIEVQIPYAAIESELPQKMAGLLSGKSARPFIRVETLAFDQKSRSIVDHGPSVASYRFLANEYDLDGYAPGDNRKTLPIAVPFQGKWFVGHGAMGYITHLNVHAYDLYLLDHLGFPAKTQLSRNNPDYYTWGLPLSCPIDGRVIGIRDDQPDSEPMQKESNRANKLVLAVDGGNDLQLHMLHLQQDSTTVRVGQNLRAGQPVARAGNSGYSQFTHLHLELTKGNRPGPNNRPKSPAETFTIPLAFERTILSLNPVANDPWARYVENWEIRNGVFVEPVEK